MDKETAIAIIRQQATVNELKYMLIEQQELRFDVGDLHFVLNSKHWDRFSVRIYRQRCFPPLCDTDSFIIHASEVFPSEVWLYHPDCRCKTGCPPVRSSLK